MDQILSHKYFAEYESTFQKLQSEIAEALRKAALKEISGKESIATAVQKTEQRLRDEQKLVSREILWVVGMAVNINFCTCRSNRRSEWLEFRK